jgi:hypothetical protein
VISAPVFSHDADNALQTIFTVNFFLSLPFQSNTQCSSEFKSSDCRISDAYGEHNTAAILLFSWQGHYPIGGSRIHLSLVFPLTKGPFLEFFCVVAHCANTWRTGIIKLWSYVCGQTPSKCWRYLLYFFLLIYHNHSPVVSNFSCPECGSFSVVPKSFFLLTLYCADKIIV